MASVEESDSVVGELKEIMKEINGFPECLNTSKDLHRNLVRKLKMLSPLFDKLRDIEEVLGDKEIQELVFLKAALEMAKDLLRSVNEGSKIYQGGNLSCRFYAVGGQFCAHGFNSSSSRERVLILDNSRVPQGISQFVILVLSFEVLFDYISGISQFALQREEIADKFQEVTEQIEKALSEISYDKFSLSEEVQEQIELVHAQFRRAKGRTDSPDLELYTDLAIAREEKIPNPAILKGLAEKLQLRTINDLKKESLALHKMVISITGCPWDRIEEMSALLKKLKDLVLMRNPKADTSESEKSLVNHRSPTIPNDFRCPISLHLMEDPVIVYTGQTFERSSIQKWLDTGHKTCPKTQHFLLHTALTPNFVLKSLIDQWCKNNHIELRRKQGSLGNRNSGSGLSDWDLIDMEILLQKLSIGHLKEQRAAAGELRLLAKRDADKRICIADAGAIPLLEGLLSSSDLKTQEHAVTALLNLSLNETNKGSFDLEEAIPDIVDVLRNGSMEARENAAFSLSLIDTTNKVAIGAAGAFPALIDLLCQGSQRGKMDAATAIFNLSSYQANKVRAVRPGIVVPLMRLMMDAGDMQHLKTAAEHGAEEALKELSENGTDRAKRKARYLLELFHRTADMMASVVESDSLADELKEIMKEINGFPECLNTFKDLYWNLVRKLNLLSPLFDELKDIEKVLGDKEIQELVFLKAALGMAKDLLRSINEGSKIYLALQREVIADKFHEVTYQIEKALSEISYDKLYLSEEVQEQIELVHGQFRRTKGRMDSTDLELYTDLAIAREEKIPNPAILTELAEKLQLRTINDLKKESLALHEMGFSSSGCPWDLLEEMSDLLKKLKDLVLSENPEADTSEIENSLVNHRSPIIPNDFQCPVSLDLMKDPVTVSTGQTYERSSIQKWLDVGNETCPKTLQTLLHRTLAPNFGLKSLIAQWCENNHIEIPTKKMSSDSNLTIIDALRQKLSNGNPEEHRTVARAFQLLAKTDANNRIRIAEAGVIPMLVELLSSSDPKTQEHAVTALLNLSKNETNKGSIVNAGAIPDIVDVLRNGSMEARENAAATLFSLSLVDDNKVAIGAAGAIPALIGLLCQGSRRGKKDAATAIFNLSIYQGNKVRAVRAGIVVPLMRLMMDVGSGMVDEALTIMVSLARHQEGEVAIGQANPIPILVDIIRTGSPHNRENAAALLWSLCPANVQHLRTAGELGAREALKELSENGTDRAKRKARYLLEILH
ncbi:hypothetical protein HHK36_018168 [Tetracentron sinense]|uniref:U-box domain-containing protein 12 n=1 Tax=Tetracentron sinense TaxID=13715 RepID=A0A835DDR6_TETSI|nr:hypothetical protein HHK36_018168 [Tetracentron sinense]